MTDIPQNQPDIKAYNYIVTYIDILGQKAYLSEMPKILPPEGERNELMQNLKDTYGKVYCVRETIKGFFDASINRKSPDWHNILSSNQKNVLKGLEAPEVHCLHFADAMIIYSRLINSQDIFNLSSVLTMLGGCISILLLGLGRGIPLRGGIEIGIAIDWHEFGIYGSALYGAYDLESKIAQYPRIVIGEELKNCLLSCKQDPRDDPVHLLNKRLADKCWSMICEDQDGMPIVDFLNIDSICDLFGYRKDDQDCQKLRDAVAKGFEFIKAEHDKYKAEKNTKLAFRYALLLDYYMDRLSGWGINESE